MTPSSSVAELLLRYFPFTPTPDQLALFQRMEDFLSVPPTTQAAFILKGYAGTGKTTVIKTLTKVFRKLGYPSVLLTPTGRAAKIVSQYTHRKSYTIHRQIYKQVQNPFSGSIQFELQKNYQQHTLYIVDEASMITHQQAKGEHNLLDDLISYVFSNEANRLIFIGDGAQLPPVGQALSFALSSDKLGSLYSLQTYEHQLTEVVRHEQQSGILENATRLRHALQQRPGILALDTKGYPDIFRMPSARLTEGLSYAYLKYGISQTLLVCPSNQEAARLNNYIRQEILHRPKEIEAGDLLMIVRNNYQILPKSSRIGFLANGEFAEIVAVVSQEEVYGFRFAQVLLRLPDYPKQKIFQCRILLDTLTNDLPALSPEHSRQLYESVSVDYQHIPQRSRQLKAIRKDPYLNALQVKFAYALTCHKAQGGQWEAVFVHPGHLAQSTLHPEAIRWLYTAFTRARKELFLLDFHQAAFCQPPSGEEHNP